MRRPPTNDERGEIVHTLFEQLCASMLAGATRQKVDKHGWDNHVTLPVNRSESAPAETRATERRVKVQVKAVDEDATSVPIRLSNAERMAKEQIPWFLFVGRMPKGGTVVTETYLVHFDEATVGRVLKRLRKLDATPGAKANDQTISIPFDETHLVAGADALLERIVRDVGSTEAEYNTAKQRSLETVGYAEDRYQGQFSITGKEDDVFNSVAAWMLGDGPLNVSSLALSEYRFGLKKILLQPTEATLEVPQPVSRGESRVHASNLSGSRSFSFLTQTFVASLPKMPQRYVAVRLALRGLSMTIRNLHEGSATLTLQVPDPLDEENLDLELTKTSGALVELIGLSGMDGLEFSIKLPGVEQSFQMSLGNTVDPIPERAAAIAITGRAAATLLSDFADVGDVRVRVKDVLEQGHPIALTSLAKRREVNSLCQIWLPATSPVIEVEGERVAIAPGFSLRTSAGFLLGTCALSGKVERVGDAFRYRAPRVHHTEVRLVEASEEEADATLERMLKTSEAKAKTGNEKRK